MAEIFLARTTTELGGSRLVVVKVILPHLADSPEFSEMLITEAKLAGRLNHANVVQVTDLGQDGGCLYIAMQYVEGFDLNELLRKCARTKTPLPTEYALLVVIEVLRALDYAHRRTTEDGRPLGIVHRDVSPSNVLLSLEGEVKLCDFGIARANDLAEVLPEDAVRGKAGYMSPEQAEGEPLDGRADLFAATIVLWELLAGRRMYKAPVGAGASLLDQARAGVVPDLEPRGLPNEAELFAIVKKGLARSRDDRHPSALAMLRELEAYAAKSGMFASSIRFGEWLMEHFGEELVSQRRARERAAKALEAGPLARVQAIGGSAYAKTPMPDPVRHRPPSGAPPGLGDGGDGPPPSSLRAVARDSDGPPASLRTIPPSAGAPEPGARLPWIAIVLVLALAAYFVLQMR
jgi:serine/threonine-protein kinase